MALKNAAKEEDVEAVGALLSTGTHPNVRHPNGGVQALHSAAGSGSVAVARLLLERGARVEPNDFGQTPVHYAAEEGHDAFLQLVCEQPGAREGGGREGGGRALGGRLGVAANVTAAHALATAHALTAPLCNPTWPPPTRAGVDVNAADQYGQTPLLFASMHGHLEAARVLLEHGAGPGVLGADGVSPLVM